MKLMNLIETFAHLAFHWHQIENDQVRKYSGLPYVTHTLAVAHRYRSHFPDDIIGIAAAHAHDILEDTLASTGLLAGQAKLLMNELYNFREVSTVLGTISELTSAYRKEDFPHLSRADRKEREAARLGIISQRAQHIKLADILDNTLNLATYDPKFARIYLPEQEAKLKALTLGTGPLRFLAERTIEQEKRKLGID